MDIRLDTKNRPGNSSADVIIDGVHLGYAVGLYARGKWSLLDLARSDTGPGFRSSKPESRAKDIASRVHLLVPQAEADARARRADIENEWVFMQQRWAARARDAGPGLVRALLDRRLVPAGDIAAGVGPEPTMADAEKRLDEQARQRALDKAKLDGWKKTEGAYIVALLQSRGNTDVPEDSVPAYIETQIAMAAQDGHDSMIRIKLNGVLRMILEALWDEAKWNDAAKYLGEYVARGH